MWDIVAVVNEAILVINAAEVERLWLVRACQRAKFEVIEADSAIEGLFETLERNPDLILLAEEVPPMHAGDLLPLLRRLTSAPILIVGGGGDPEEIAAVDLGADIYLRRPFSARALVARAHAVLRRYRGSLASDFIVSRIRDCLPRLSPTEKRLLACLMLHNGRPVASADLSTEVYGGTTTAGAVKMALWRLRHKLGACGLTMVAHLGVGYRLVMEEGQYASAQKAS
jgi:DNA-binding response OmpR family regulator